MAERGSRGGASLLELCEGNLEGGLPCWGNWRIGREDSGDGHLSLHRGPVGEPGGDSLAGTF